MDIGNISGIGDFWVNVISLLIALLGLGFGIWTYFRSKQRKLITYEIEDHNTNVVSIDRDKGENIKIFLDDEQVSEVRYQLIKIRNEGNVVVDKADYNNPLKIEVTPQSTTNTNQPSQVILRAGIPEAAPDLEISSLNAKDYINLDTQNQFVTLKDVMLNAGDWIRVKVLTLGKVNIKVTAQIKDGHIKPFAPVPISLTWKKTGGYILLGALLFFLIYNSQGLITAFIRGDCVPGSIEVKGSSAFYAASANFARGYHTDCPIGFVHVDEDTSSSGLLDLKNGSIQVANSEVPGSVAGLNSAEFKDHQIAAIVFTVIINKDVTGIISLTHEQLLKIYKGTYQNWKDVDSRAPDLAIKVFGRPTTSGTHATFIRYVLGTEARNAPSYQDVDRTDLMAQMVARTPGAIGYVDVGTAGRMSAVISSVEIDQEAPTYALVENNAYHFWAVEHMYTRQNPDKLVSSFITYLTNHIETDATFIKLQDIPVATLQTHV
ncbi:MAG TPA: substrate-binding domain-containing protein [Ktedonobacteraceae bacterium]|jgi:phosphate transport system substrate-binding protein|nr:substrate-binding domain-containing protein [Ktedonobacteraceae bacterium]